MTSLRQRRIGPHEGRAGMRVGMYYNNSKVEIEELPVPKVGKRDILVKVMASGICGSDVLEWYRS